MPDNYSPQNSSCQNGFALLMHTKKTLHFDTVQLLPIEKSPESYQQTIKKNKMESVGKSLHITSKVLMYQCFPEVIGIDAWQCQGKQREQMSSSFQVPAGDHEERQFTVSPPTTHALSYTQPCPAILLTVRKNGRGGLGAFIVSIIKYEGSPTERMYTF